MNLVLTKQRCRACGSFEIQTRSRRILTSSGSYEGTSMWETCAECGLSSMPYRVDDPRLTQGGEDG